MNKLSLRPEKGLGKISLIFVQQSWGMLSLEGTL